MTFAPRTWVVGEVVAAATLNAEIRDQFNSMFGTWTTYTPTWTAATTNPTLGNGTLTGRHMKIGRTVICEIILTLGSTTTVGSGTYQFGAPFTTANSGVDAIGSARLSAGSVYLGGCILGAGQSAITVTFGTATAPTAASMSGSAPATLAASHTLRLAIVYEAAT